VGKSNSNVAEIGLKSYITDFEHDQKPWSQGQRQLIHLIVKWHLETEVEVRMAASRRFAPMQWRCCSGLSSECGTQTCVHLKVITPRPRRDSCRSQGLFLFSTCLGYCQSTFRTGIRNLFTCSKHTRSCHKSTSQIIC
jgi:hypothetical protein